MTLPSPTNPASRGRTQYSIQVGEPATWHGRIREMFAVIDTKSIDGFLAYLTSDTVFRFGNSATLTGHPAIRESLVGFFASIEALQHKVAGTWVQQGAAFCRLEVEYTRLDGKHVTLPVATLFLFRGELITDYEVYMDISPVYAASLQH